MTASNSDVLRNCTYSILVQQSLVYRHYFLSVRPFVWPIDLLAHNTHPHVGGMMVPIGKGTHIVLTLPWRLYWHFW